MSKKITLNKTQKKNIAVKSGGFTLIELLIVIVILGILSAIGLGFFTSAQKKSRDAQRKGSLDSITTALEVYYNDYGSYPNDDGSGNISGCGPSGITACSYGSEWSDSNTIYMVQLPTDPAAYSFYYLSSSGADYRLYARLENVNDKGVPLAGSTPQVYSEVFNKCGGNGCNYGVASTNTTLSSTQDDTSL